MNRRSFTGLVLLAAFVASLLDLWQPWDTSGEPPLALGLDLQGGLRVVLQSDTPNPSSEDLNTARRVVENRVNQFGVSEPLVQTSGRNRIVVELPGLTAAEQDRALDLIGQQAVLEFRLAKPNASPPYTLDDLEPAAFTGKILSGAQAGFGQFGENVVTFDIKSQYADDFGEFTQTNRGRAMAIVLDGNIISAPVINSRIDAHGQITGNFTLDEASDLALVLRSGSLPINLHVEEVRAIGPTLGQDSINAGVRAAIIGGAAVVALILLYYGPLFGGVLTVGLFYAMLLIFGALAGLGAALTL
ncbi:MAG TPA: protein translocase subunit SecDF, partial [Trueperaceae bacterium]